MESCDDLVEEAGITSIRGWMLYINNYSMSMALAKSMFNKYVWTIFLLSYQQIRGHVIIMIFLSSRFQIYQVMGCNKDGTVRQKSRSILQPERHTIFSAQLGATRRRFDF